jgi:hypothetical protein
MKRQVVPLISVFGIIYLVATIGSHLLFNLWDAAGAHCRESETQTLVYPVLDEEVDVKRPFGASDLCWASGVHLAPGHRYQITIIRTSPLWRDSSPFGGDGFAVGLGGLEGSDQRSFGERVMMSLGIPLRRVLMRPWFRIIGRIGAVGTDEYYLDPAQTEGASPVLQVALRTRRGGELFLYVNDAVIGWPRFADFFYRPNQGEAQIKIKHVAAR